MTTLAKKSNERLYLDLFQKLLGEQLGEKFPEGETVEHEEPDFLARGPQGSLGIEITELVHRKHPNEEYSAAEKAGFCDKVVRDARRLCEEWGVPPLSVTVWIIGSLDRLRGSPDRRELSKDLARFVKQWCDEHAEDEDASPKPEDALPEIWRIRLSRAHDSGAHNWQWDPGAVCVGPVSIDSLQACISGKDNDYERYRGHCTECWLITVGDPCDPGKASDITIDPSVTTHLYKSRFDRVFYLQLLDQLVELQRRAP